MKKEVPESIAKAAANPTPRGAQAQKDEFLTWEMSKWCNDIQHIRK